MSIYRTLKGYNIKSVTSDPANTKEGQIWYNDTSNKIRVNTIKPATWASGGNYPATAHGIQGDGTQTAAFAAGGSADTDETNEYNGSSWTAGNNMGTARYTFGANGSQTAGLAFGGYNPGTAGNIVNVEEYDGTNWAEQNNLPAATQQNTGCGTQTEA